MARRRFTERQVLAVLIAQGAVIPCYRCRVAIEDASQVEREHVTTLALGGEDTPENCRFSHAECHKKQTNGHKGTSYGSDKHAIAKDKRLRGETGKGPKRPIKSRGFQPRLVPYSWPSRKFGMTRKRSG